LDMHEVFCFSELIDDAKVSTLRCFFGDTTHVWN
jgi:hypothetical protein